MSEQNESEILKPGMIVDGYRIERELGRGAMAVVYLTQQLNLQRPVALKIMSMEFAANKDYVRRFFNEVRTAAALSHPNIVQAYDAGVAFENTYYFAMEYVDGVSMLKKIESEGRIPALEALAYARAIASALDYGWQKMRFRHGDIKPENFMVQKDGQIKLTDFGLAMVKGHEYHGNELMLTPHYASPELIQGIRSKNNCLADIYAFGASLYHMLSGTTPYVGDDAREVMRRHLNEKLEPLRHRCPDIPKCLSEFVGDIMEKDPSRRLQDWTMVLSGIDAVTDELLAKRAVVGTEKEQFSESPETITLKTLEGKKARPLTAQKRRLTARAYRDYRKKKSFSGWVIADVLIVLLVLGLVGFYFYRQNKNKKIRRDFWKTAQIIQQVNPNLNVEGSTVPELKQEPRQSDDIKNGKKDAPLAHESVVEKQAVPAFSASGEKPQKQKEENDLSAVRALIESPAAVLQNGKSAPQKSAIVVKKLRLPDYKIKLSLPYDMRNALYLTKIQLFLNDFQYHFGENTDVEKTMGEMERWLKDRSDKTRAETLVRFLCFSVFPLAAEYPAYLEQNSTQFVGENIYLNNQKKIWYRILKIQLDGVQLEQCFERGKMILPLRSWENLQKDALLQSLLVACYQKAHSEQETLRLFSYFLLSGEYRKCRIVLKKLQENQDILKELLDLLDINNKEKKSLKLFQELLVVLTSGSRAQAGKLLVQLQYQNTEVVRRNKFFIVALQEICNKYVPEIQGASLVRSAGKMTKSNPKQALNDLFRVEGLYSGKYPEFKKCAEVEDRVWSAIRKQNILSYDGDAMKDNLPFLHETKKKNYLTRRNFCLEGSDTFDDYKNPEIPLVYKAFVQAEIGQWKNFRELPGRLQDSVGSWPQQMQLLWIFGHAVYHAFSGTGSFGEEQLLQFFHDTSLADEWLYVLPEYILLTHQNSLCNSGYNQCSDEKLSAVNWALPQPEGVQKLLLLSWTIKLEKQDTNYVLKELSHLQEIQKNAENPLDAKAISMLDFLQQCGLIIRKSEVQKEDVLYQMMQKPTSLSAEKMRLLFVSFGKRPISERCDSLFWEWLQQQDGASGLMGGNVLYDYLLRRVSYCLEKGDVLSAVCLTERALQTPAVHLWGYYSRLQYLQGGLFALTGNFGGLVDAAEAISNAKWCEFEENKRLLIKNENQLEVVDSAIGGALCFWNDWLKRCIKIGQQNIDDDSYSVGQETMLAESCLMQGLKKYHSYCTKDVKIVWSKEF